MPLAQDQSRQITHKIHSSQFLLRKDALKELWNGDPKDLWQIDISEDEKLASGNDREPEKDKKNTCCNQSDFSCIEDGHYVDEDVRKEWQEGSGGYEWRQNANGEYGESDCSDDNREDRRYCYRCYRGNASRDCKESRTSEYRCQACSSVCYQQMGKTKSGMVHGCDGREITGKTRRRNSKEEFERWAQSKDNPHRKGCSENLRGCSEHAPNRTRQSHGLECNEMHRCNEYSARYQSERSQNTPVHMLMYSKSFKNVHHARKNKSSEEQIYRNNSKSECCHHTKKILNSYEQLPAVDESLEQLSDATYKASSYTNFQNAGDSHSNTPTNKNENKIKNLCARTPSWVLCDKSAESALTEALSYDVCPEKFRKTRSRRTKMNRNWYIKWKKALIHPILGEGSRKEMVGVMVLGQNGPEYYSKLSNKNDYLPFRKSRSFPEDQTKSKDISFNYEPKDRYFAASEPAQKPRSEPKTPEEDNKIEEKIANFDKNIEKLVNRTNEKFLRSLSKEQTLEAGPTMHNETCKKKLDNEAPDENEEEMTKKSQSVQLMPCELLSSRAPKSMMKIDRSGRDIFAFNVESKIMADTLNERAKQFQLSELAQKENKLDELEKKFPPKQIDKETKDANLMIWGMKRNEAELKELQETERAGGEGDGNELSLRLRIPIRLNAESNQCDHHPNKEDEKEMTEEAMGKLSDEMHRERRKKFYGSILKESEEKKQGRRENPEKKEGDVEEKSQKSEKLKASPENEQILFDMFKNLVKDGCAISEKESENLQKILQTMRYETDVNGEESTTSEADSKTSEETARKGEKSINWKKSKETVKTRSKKNSEQWDDCQSDGISKKFSKLKSSRDDQLERKTWKKLRRDLKGKKRHLNVDKMRLKMIRDVLPSMAAENEAAHLKQLKKYIHRFIDGVELKISSSPETRKVRKAKTRDTTSTGSSEVRIDARKVIDLVSNPFKRITSDVTNAIAQESCSKCPKNFPSSSKTRRNSDETEEASVPCPTTSGSDREEEAEPTYMEGLKKMRNDHLVNIMMEVRRLREVIRFLDRCNRLKL